jgi:hypothetical protein
MSHEPLSRELAADLCTGPTLADVLKAVVANEALTRRQRDDQASAIRTLAKTLGRRPGDLPADPGRLQAQVGKVDPVAVGLSRRRWRNVLSLTRTALRQAGINSAPGRHTTPLSAAWKDLYRQLNRTSWRIGLSRFAHFCSERHVDPSQVDDAVMAEYLRTLLEDALIGEPREVHRTTCVCWNEALAAIPTWPRTPVEVPCYLETYTLDWDAFPASLKRDADGYLKHLSGEDLLAEVDFRPLRPSSLRKKEYELRSFASALALRGRDPAGLKSLADLVAPMP